MNLDALMVRFILENALSFKWSIQGLGMLRLYLDTSTRLHVWSSVAKRPDVSTIHDHPWSFTSTIISGRLTNVLYHLSGALEPLTHMKQQILCGPGGGIVKDPEPVNLYLRSAATYWPGETYSQDAEEIHESLPEAGTVTVIARRFREDTEHAHVFYPITQKWVSAEPRVATLEEVDRIAKAALARWDTRR